MILDWTAISLHAIPHNPVNIHFFLVRNYRAILRNKMAHAKVIIARNSAQRIPIEKNPNIYCSVYIPPKCICSALFIFQLLTLFILHCLYSSQVYMYCVVHIPPKCIYTALFTFLPSVYILHCSHSYQVYMYGIVYISPKSMCYVLFTFLQVHVYCIVCFSSRFIWVAFFHFSHFYVYCSVFIPASLCEITINFFGCKIEIQLFNSFRKLF